VPDSFTLMVLPPAAAFVLTLLFVPGVRRLATRCGCVSLPTKDRWHLRPTPSLGGLAFFSGFTIPVLVCLPHPLSLAPLFLVVFQMLVLGAYDDLRHINPAAKFIGQIIAAATALLFGYSLQFFGWPFLDALVTVLLIVGLTNAINLLDNMDGLAAGIGFIAAVYLGFLFQQHGDLQYCALALALAGALGGFLVYNVHPASVFMGDAGSLFLGSTLSLLALKAHGQASSIVSLVAIPTLILLVPIVDTALVTFTRILRGQSIVQGGKDHASHRLVTLGLTESRAVLLLCVMAAASGAAALVIEQVAYVLSLVLLPLVVISFALFTAYLAQVEVVSEEEGARRAREKGLPALLISLTYKRRILEVVLDLFLISFAYYLALMLRYDFHLSTSTVRLYLASLPVVLVATYGAFYVLGVYRGVWRYTDVEDLLRLAKSVLVATLLAVAALLFFYRFAGHSRVVFILYALLLFLGVAGSRLSFRLFAHFVGRQASDTVPVLVYGAGDGGEVVVRECRNNTRVNYQPVGFLDDDPSRQGQVVLGLPVFGGVDALPDVLRREDVRGVIISSPKILANGNAEKVHGLCQEKNMWIKRLSLEFVGEDAREV